MKGVINPWVSTSDPVSAVNNLTDRWVVNRSLWFNSSSGALFRFVGEVSAGVGDWRLETTGYTAVDVTAGDVTSVWSPRLNDTVVFQRVTTAANTNTATVSVAAAGLTIQEADASLGTTLGLVAPGSVVCLKRVSASVCRVLWRLSSPVASEQTAAQTLSAGVVYTFSATSLSEIYSWTLVSVAGDVTSSIRFNGAHVTGGHLVLISEASLGSCYVRFTGKAGSPGTAPTLMTFDTVTADNVISKSEVSSANISGAIANGAGSTTVTVTVSDRLGFSSEFAATRTGTTFSFANPEWYWFSDGYLVMKAVQSDGAGGYRVGFGMTHKKTGALPTGSGDVVQIFQPVDGDNGIDPASANAVVLSGVATPGAAMSISVVEIAALAKITQTTTAGTDGYWSSTFNLTGLTNGAMVVNAVATSGSTSVISDQLVIYVATLFVDPPPPILVNASNIGELNWEDPFFPSPGVDVYNDTTGTGVITPARTSSSPLNIVYGVITFSAPGLAAGSAISAATLTLNNLSESGNVTSGRIVALKSGAASIPADYTDYLTRTLTTASVSMTTAIVNAGVSNAFDVKAILQELQGAGGWGGSSNVIFVIEILVKTGLGTGAFQFGSGATAFNLNVTF